MVEAATGTVVSSQRFDSFGLRTATGPLLQRYGFTGREHDAESGLIYFRARAYDPAIGQFLQRDPIGFSSGDLNLYAYVENNPFNWSDPSGLSPSAGNLVTTAGAIAVSGSLFGAIWRLTNLIVTAMAIDNLKNPPDNPPDNPPVPDTADCDPAKNPKGCEPKECTGDIGYDLRISGGDGRIGNDLTKIPLGTMGPNEAFRLLGYLSYSQKLVTA